MAMQDRPDLPEGQWLELIQRYQDMQPHENSRDRPPGQGKQVQSLEDRVSFADSRDGK